MQGEAEFEEWQQDFEVNWSKPEILVAIRMQWAMMPQQARDLLREQRPEEYKQIMDFMQQEGR